MAKISEFQQKDIVNITDGKKLGMIHDLEVDITTGQIIALYVSANTRWTSMFQRDDEIRVLWSQIRSIGKDIIFVEMTKLKTIFTENEEK
ncbi:MAG: YlmC/YmxH family sporulation protein [Bacillus sp. (in: firmicutes)]